MDTNQGEENQMTSETYWNIFVNTGSVDSYLLYRAGETEETEKHGADKNGRIDSEGMQFE